MEKAAEALAYRLVTVAYVAAMLSVTEVTVYAMIREQRLPQLIKIGKNASRLRFSEVLTAIESFPRGPKSMSVEMKGHRPATQPQA